MIILLLCFSQTDCQALSICGFLHHTLLNLRRIPRNARNRIFFMHDVLYRISTGKSALFYNKLLELYDTGWIGHNLAPHLWPARLPDLNPLDFYFSESHCIWVRQGFKDGFMIYEIALKRRLLL